MDLHRLAGALMLAGAIVVVAADCQSSDDDVAQNDDGGAGTSASAACAAVCSRSDVRDCFNIARPCETACNQARAQYGMCVPQYDALLVCLSKTATVSCKDGSYGVDLDVSPCPWEASKLSECTGYHDSGIQAC